MIEDKIKYILRKYPETKFNRSEFMWKYLEEYHEATIYVMKKQFKEFWREEASLERILRNVLREPEFTLPPEQDLKRYEKAAVLKKEFKSWRKKLTDEDKKNFETAFGGDTEDERAENFSKQCLI